MRNEAVRIWFRFRNPAKAIMPRNSLPDQIAWPTEFNLQLRTRTRVDVLCGDDQRGATLARSMPQTKPGN